MIIIRRCENGRWRLYAVEVGDSISTCIHMVEQETVTPNSTLAGLSLGKTPSSMLLSEDSHAGYTLGEEFLSEWYTFHVIPTPHHPDLSLPEDAQDSPAAAFCVYSGLSSRGLVQLLKSYSKPSPLDYHPPSIPYLFPCPSPDSTAPLGYAGKL
ncbi:hypothetical protein ACJZ2D_013182 [Fusarium nematophilum]